MIYLILFLEFFKIGLFTFGGGYAMIPLIKEVVLNYEWLSETEFYDFIGICEITPGPIAINMASFVGFNQAGLLGCIISTLGVIIPSFIIIVLIASIFKNFINNKNVKYFFNGVRPIIIGLILSSGLVLLFKSLGYVSLKEFNFNFISMIICICLILILLVCKFVFKKKMNNVLFIVISAILGILFSI